MRSAFEAIAALLLAGAWMAVAATTDHAMRDAGAQRAAAGRHPDVMVTVPCPAAVNMGPGRGAACTQAASPGAPS